MVGRFCGKKAAKESHGNSCASGVISNLPTHTIVFEFKSGRAQGDGTKVTENAENCGFSEIFTPSPGNSQHSEGAGNRRKQKGRFAQETAAFRRKPQETTDWAPSP